MYIYWLYGMYINIHKVLHKWSIQKKQVTEQEKEILTQNEAKNNFKMGQIQIYR